MGGYLERLQEHDLKKWLQGKNRKPLVIRGARQVGKSTLVRNFCQKNKLDLIEINLEKYLYLNEIFQTNDIKLILSNIEDISKKKITKKSLLFLDEIQANPYAIQALRYFFEEEKGLAVVAAGSLLEFTLNDHSYSMPVGRIEFLHMGPMTFSEFLLAKNEKFILNRLSKIKNLDEISDSLHNQCVELLREFYFVGGMPEAILTSIGEDFERVANVQENILSTYQNDFVKYAKKSALVTIQKVFKYIYLHPCRKIKYSNISPDHTSRELHDQLDLLFMAKVAFPVKHSSCDGIPLAASESDKIFKTLVLDIGLMNSLHGLSWSHLKNNDLLLTEGNMAEQFIGQHLLYASPSFKEPQLHYWLREGKSHNAEIDYVVTNNSSLVGIEVKSGAAGKIRSLHQWVHDAKAAKKKCIRFNLSKGSVEKINYQLEDKVLKYDLLTLPLYLVEYWKNFIS
jgi:predicted AAA+ superfamily ATPase